ncbi:hypothetical protein GCK32_013156, partial [Trichostrongylus colubriformis]
MRKVHLSSKRGKLSTCRKERAMCVSSIAFVAVSLLTPQAVLAIFDHSTCGKEKGCVAAPKGCEAANSCQFHFSYKPDGDHLEMELSGIPSHDDGYVAVGFSKNDKMWDDLIVYCARSEGKVKGGLAVTTKPIHTVDNTNIQTIKSAGEADGHLNCVIRQLKKVETNEDLKKYDLGESYHILFARGPYNET